MIFVALDHPRHALHDRVTPLRIAAGNIFLLVRCPVRLHVGLVNHVQAVLITQFIPDRVIGIMTGADGVDVAAFHQENVLQHALARHMPTGVRVVFVATDSFDLDGAAVDVDL